MATTRRPSRGAVRQTVARPRKQWIKRPDWNIKPALTWTSRLAMVAIVSFGVYSLWPHINQPVTHVEFTGELNRVDTGDMRAQVEATIDRGLLALDLDRLEATVEALPWVDTAEIQKRWPNRLIIQVAEERPVARWGTQGYLAESGLMVPSAMFEDLSALPSFDVGVTAPAEALDLFYGFHTAMLSTGLGIQELRQSRFGSWSMVMKNGSEVVLGKDDLMVRIRRVIQAWQKLSPEHINELEAIDARYPNGVAVKYRPQMAQESTSLIGGEKI